MNRRYKPDPEGGHAAIVDSGRPARHVRREDEPAVAAPEHQPSTLQEAGRTALAALTGVALAAAIATLVFLSGVLPDRSWPSARPPAAAAGEVQQATGYVTPGEAPATVDPTTDPTAAPAEQRAAERQRALSPTRPATPQAMPAVTATPPLPELTVTPRPPSTGTYPYPPTTPTSTPEREPIDCAAAFEEYVANMYPGVIFGPLDPSRLDFMADCRFYLGGR